MVGCRTSSLAFRISLLLLAIGAVPAPGLAEAALSDSLATLWSGLPAQARLDSLMTKAASLQRRRPDWSQQLLLAALPIADRQGNDKQRVAIRNELGSLFLQLDDYPAALSYLEKARDLSVDLPADTLLADTYTYLGIIFERTGKYDQSLAYLQKAGELGKQLKLGPEAAARNLTNMGHVYEQLEDYQKAIQAYEQALQICTDHDIRFGEALLNQNLANAHNALGKFRAAIAFSLQSQAIAREHGFSRIEIASHQNLGASLMGLGRWQGAITEYQAAFLQARAATYGKALLDATLQLSHCYEAVDDEKSALAYFKTHARIKDSIFSAEKTEKIEALQAAFQAKERDAAIRELKRENSLTTLRQQRTNLLFGFVLLVTGGGAFLIWFRQRQLRAVLMHKQAIDTLRQDQARQTLENDRMRYELNALKAQMNPHFLFNALNGIQELFLTGQTREANEYLGKFSDLTRSILHASGRNLIPMSEEVSMLRDYLDLESLRFNGDLDYRIESDPDLAASDVALPPMLVQPYVENAIKHGLMHKSANRSLSIRFALHGPGLMAVEIEDNGVGREKAAYFAAVRQGRHNHFATSATEKRLELLNHGREHAITAKTEDLSEQGQPAGTRVTIFIPVETE